MWLWKLCPPLQSGHTQDLLTLCYGWPDNEQRVDRLIHCLYRDLPCCNLKDTLIKRLEKPKPCHTVSVNHSCKNKRPQNRSIKTIQFTNSQQKIYLKIDFIILFWLANKCLILPSFFLYFGLTLFIEASFVLSVSLPHSLFQSHNNLLFPCVLLKFPTHFMVTLNDLIICLPISKTDFDPTNSFPWKPKGDSIKAASNLRWVIKKESAGIN